MLMRIPLIEYMYGSRKMIAENERLDGCSINNTFSKDETYFIEIQYDSIISPLFAAFGECDLMTHISRK